MFENCGSCFAAEQFVDIKLGAKSLLTLTSYDNCIIKGDLASPSSTFYKKIKFWLFFTKKDTGILGNEETISGFS